MRGSSRRPLRIPIAVALAGTALGCLRSGELPLVAVPARTPPSGTVAVLLSGDGGWARIDRALARHLAERGIPTLGLDSLRYFWTRRTPDEVTRDLGTMIERALERWNGQRVVLIGYSRGAGALALVAAGLPGRLRERVALVALLSPARRVALEFQVPDWWRGRPPADARPVLPQLERLRGTPILCLYGRDDAAALCPTLPPGLAAVASFPAGHHLGGDYGAVADAILARLSERPGEPSRAGPQSSASTGKRASTSGWIRRGR